MIHELKTTPVFFENVREEKKTFEVRRADRPFGVGDFLALNEYTENGYTGRCMLVRVIYILNDTDYCKDGYWILGIEGCSIRGKGRAFQEEMTNRYCAGIPIYNETVKMASEGDSPDE